MKGIMPTFLTRLDWSSLPFEFHVSRTARDRYQFPHTLFATNGRVVFANFHAARLFAQKMNEKRDLARYPEQAVKAAQINAMGLMHEVLHHLIVQYRQQKNGKVFTEALAWIEAKLGSDQLEATLLRFCEDFPPRAVYQREITLAEYFAGETDGMPNREIALEEMLMLWISNINPASAPYIELFDDSELSRNTGYKTAITELHNFFDTQPGFGPQGQNLIDLLRAPALANPHSFTAQLQYMLQSWGPLLGDYFYQMLQSLDFIKEEEKPVFFGPGPSLVPDYRRGRRGERVMDEPERFSPDKDWMPRVTMLAKNTYVWLEQLARKYSQEISRLDQIPDEELDSLAEQGFTGLWFIGLWERSRASQRIKQMCGNPDAVASAYSLLSYEIADDLGGWPALESLRHRAWQRGIRLASDMVPNHMGIDSNWVLDHPDWFISLPYAPFPTYTFNGVNLSPREGVGIYLEDHYYDKTDAAVTFKRVDFHTGDTRYVYHGNDGTSMPWNDTAQLNYLDPQVREAVIQTILHVARNFPIIRFDAAMTLAKKHYQRLWFPEPGTGGAIPSRAEHGLTIEDFDRAIPEEFWREVVDRVAAEVPETLLLAEAFWMMEGYFVRSLGMHRVYNSAFMNMLRDEENAKYRLVMKNTLEFDPDILKRFVNFMNNPDERTAIDQFGNGDKYFGICTLMCTLPGLPMFGHGQIEGFHEKYGMEYRSAKWHENPDNHLVERHEREIFPLLHKRHIFSEVQDFVLYDFWTSDGYVHEDVFAYSNRRGDERALVIYLNKFADVRGWIRTSVGAIDKGTRQISQRSLGDSLGLQNEPDRFAIFRDLASGLEFIRPCSDLCENGLYVELHAYERHVFWDWREVEDDAAHRYAHLTEYLDGRGVPSIDIALREILLRPVHEPFLQLVNAETLQNLMPAPQFEVVSVSDAPSAVAPLPATSSEIVEEEIEIEALEPRLTTLLEAILNYSEGTGDVATVSEEIQNRLQIALDLPETLTGEAGTFVRTHLNTPAAWGTLLGWVFVHDLGKVFSDDNYEETSRDWLDEWLLGRLLSATFQEIGSDTGAADYAVAVIKVLTHHQNWWQEQGTTTPLLITLFRDEDVQRAIGVNRYKDVLWFNAEAWEELTGWLFIAAAIQHLATDATDESNLTECFATIQQWQQTAEDAGYQVEKVLEGIGKTATADKVLIT